VSESATSTRSVTATKIESHTDTELAAAGWLHNKIENLRARYRRPARIRDLLARSHSEALGLLRLQRAAAWRRRRRRLRLSTPARRLLARVPLRH
jgi:hypothetical protein